MIHVDAIQLYEHLGMTVIEIRVCQQHLYPFTRITRWSDGRYVVGASVPDASLVYTTDRWEAIYEPREKFRRRWLPLRRFRELYPPVRMWG
jgi:hypothetical protein